MRVGITGGAGFIGANLSRHLLDRGAEVSIIDDLSTGFESNLDGLDVDFTRGSILGDELACLNDVDAIVHLAAVPSVPRSIKDPVASHEANATGTLRVLEQARRRGTHVVVASSSSVYGANPTLPKVETMLPMPVSPYAVSKLAAESYAMSYQRVYSLPTLAFRFFNVFGPLQAADHAYAAVVPAFCHAALRGQAVTVHGDGGQTRDFTFVGTVVDVLSQAVERGTTSPAPVNLAFGSRHSLLDVVAIIERLLGREVARDHVDVRGGDVRDSQGANTSLRALFPAVSPISLEDGLVETIAWTRAKLGLETVDRG